MGVIASQVTSLTIVYSIVYSDADQRNHQSSAPLAFVPHTEWPVTRKMFPFDDVIVKGPRNHLRYQQDEQLTIYFTDLKDITFVLAIWLNTHKHNIDHSVWRQMLLQCYTKAILLYNAILKQLYMLKTHDLVFQCQFRFGNPWWRNDRDTFYAFASPLRGEYPHGQ